MSINFYVPRTTKGGAAHQLQVGSWLNTNI